MLLALSTAHRAQTIVTIKITKIIKTSSHNKFQPLLVLPRFTEKPQLCVVETLLKYIKITTEIRKETTQLFLSIKKPHNPVSTQTFSSWIKTVLKESKIDT